MSPRSCAAQAREAGLDDAIIVNTCAVTAEAVRQARQTIRRARKRQSRREGHRHRLRRADRARDLRGHARSRSGSGQWREAGRHALMPVRCARPERVRVNDIMSVRETAAHLDRRLRRPRARLRADPERLRPPLHLLHHPLWPREVAQRAGGRGRGADPRRWSRQGIAEVVLTGVDITVLWRRPPGRAEARAVWCEQILNLVPELPRLRLSSLDVVEADPNADRLRRRRRTADAASASVAAGRRRHDPEAHEAPPSARATRSRSATSRAPPARHRLRRRPDRRLSDRNRRDVREHAGARRRLRSRPISTCSRSHRARAPRPRACRRSRATSSRRAPPPARCGRRKAVTHHLDVAERRTRSTCWSSKTAWPPAFAEVRAGETHSAAISSRRGRSATMAAAMDGSLSPERAGKALGLFGRHEGGRACAGQRLSPYCRRQARDAAVGEGDHARRGRSRRGRLTIDGYSAPRASPAARLQSRAVRG